MPLLEAIRKMWISPQSRHTLPHAADTPIRRYADTPIRRYADTPNADTPNADTPKYALRHALPTPPFTTLCLLRSIYDRY
jgi:hypothetical protein